MFSRDCPGCENVIALWLNGNRDRAKGRQVSRVSCKGFLARFPFKRFSIVQPAAALKFRQAVQGALPRGSIPASEKICHHAKLRRPCLLRPSPVDVLACFFARRPFHSHGYRAGSWNQVRSCGLFCHSSAERLVDINPAFTQLSPFCFCTNVVEQGSVRRPLFLWAASVGSLLDLHETQDPEKMKVTLLCIHSARQPISCHRNHLSH